MQTGSMLENPMVRIGDTGYQISLNELVDITTGTGFVRFCKQCKLSLLSGTWINKGTVQKLFGNLDDRLLNIFKGFLNDELRMNTPGIGFLAEVEILRRKNTVLNGNRVESSELVLEPRRFSYYGLSTPTISEDLGGKEKWDDVRKDMGEASLARLVFAYSRGVEFGDDALNQYLKTGMIRTTPQFLAHQVKIFSGKEKAKEALIRAKENFALVHARRLGVKTKEEQVEGKNRLIAEKKEELERVKKELDPLYGKKSDEEKTNFKNKIAEKTQIEKDLKSERSALQEILEKQIDTFSFSDYCRGVVYARDMLQDTTHMPQIKDRDIDFFARSLAGQFLVEIESSELHRECALRKSKKLTDYETVLDQKQESEKPEKRAFQESMLKELLDQRKSVEEVKALAKKRADRSGTDMYETIQRETCSKPLAINTSRGKFQGGIAHSRGMRNNQEDADAYGLILYRGKEVPFFALSDGHGGADIAQAVSESVEDIIQETISGGKDLADLLPLLGTKVEDFIIQQRAKGLLNVSGQSGTTLTVALIVDDEVWAVNVGDSRILLQEADGTLTQLTKDASPIRAQPSVERRGGEVLDEKRVGKGTQTLGTARSIGDMQIPGVTPRAKVTMCSLPHQGGRLILGCDGLFECLTTNEVGQLASKEVLKHNPQENAEALVYSSFAMGSEDNISALVVEIPAKKSE